MVKFFFSYAREDAEDTSLREFYVAVESDVAQLTSESATGFLDTEIVTSERWKGKLGKALGQAQVLVCMTSPRYFTRDYCGREWAAFENRMRDARMNNRILLVPWIISPFKDPPAFATEIQLLLDLSDFGDPEGSKDYRKRGLQWIADVKETTNSRQVYNAVVRKAAERIVALSETPLPPWTEDQIPDLDKIQPKFPVATSAPVIHIPSYSSPKMPADTARFTALVSRGAGGEPWRWTPYRPPNKSLGLILASASVSAGLQPTWWDQLNTDVLANIDALATLEPVIILVDSGTFTVPEHDKLLEHLDKNRFHRCAIIVIVPDDGDTDGEIESVFHRRVRDNDRHLHKSTSYDELLVELQKVLVELVQPLQIKLRPGQLPGISASKHC